MPVHISYLNNEKYPVVVAIISGNKPAEDMSQVLDGEILPYVRSKMPEIVHVIYDMRDIEWTFPTFAAYLHRTAERRKQGMVPPNQHQHFVGSGTWINNWRSWLLKNFNIHTGSFRTVEEALAFVNLEDESPV